MVVCQVILLTVMALVYFLLGMLPLKLVCKLRDPKHASRERLESEKLEKVFHIPMLQVAGGNLLLLLFRGRDLHRCRPAGPPARGGGDIRQGPAAGGKYGEEKLLLQFSGRLMRKVTFGNEQNIVLP